MSQAFSKEIPQSSTFPVPLSCHKPVPSARRADVVVDLSLSAEAACFLSLTSDRLFVILPN